MTVRTWTSEFRPRAECALVPCDECGSACDTGYVEAGEGLLLVRAHTDCFEWPLPADAIIILPREAPL